MSEFKKPGGFGGDRNRQDSNRSSSSRPSFGGRPDFNRHSDHGQERHQMFAATCDECHKQCEVPFRPTGEKPVYCRDCFSSRRESSPQSFPKRDFTPAPASNPQAQDKRIDDLKRQLDSVNGKLDMLLQLAKGEAPAPVKQVVKPVEKKAEPIAAAAVAIKTAVSPKKEDKKVEKVVEKKSVAQKKPAKKKK